MSDQLKNILLWGAFGLVAVLGFIVINNAIADEAADAERDTHAPYLTRVLSHVVKHQPQTNQQPMIPVSPPTGVSGKIDATTPAAVYCTQHGGALSESVSSTTGVAILCTLSSGKVCGAASYMNGVCK